MKVFICPECGADPYKTVDYDKMTRDIQQISDRFKRVMASHGLQQAEWVLREIDLVESTKYLQRKVKKQSEAIRRLEEKIRRLGVQPYKEDSSETIQIANMAGHIVGEYKRDLLQAKEITGM